MKRLMTAFVFTVLLLGFSGIASAYTIRDDATGWDCTQIGIWDSVAKTCTLTTDLTFGSENVAIWIDSDGITLDGNGHTITGPGSYGLGVYLYQRWGIAVKNLHISNFETGISSIYGADCTFTNNTISANIFGINVFHVVGPEIANNKVYNNNFIDNVRQVYGDYNSAYFNLDAPVGGNYWSDFDTLGEGCIDANDDRFCDSSYWIDLLPWTKRNGWKHIK